MTFYQSKKSKLTSFWVEIFQVSLMKHLFNVTLEWRIWLIKISGATG